MELLGTGLVGCRKFSYDVIGTIVGCHETVIALVEAVQQLDADICRKQAKAEMTALLNRQEARERSQLGTRRYDLSKLKMEKIAEGWRARIDPLNAPDNQQCFFVLDDGRVLHAWLNAIGATEQGKELRRLIREPIQKTDDNEE